ncbi:MAG: hypothetical protein E6J03_12775 [Chloroflexi bacterium]|nr:MAG: hypothetical protein E6J03_12775 [Chloroflexota bacterium]
MWICEAVLGEPGSTEAPSAPPARIVVHADYDLLTGANSNGRGHLEDGPALTSSMGGAATGGATASTG